MVVLEPSDPLVEQVPIEFDHFLDGVTWIDRSELLFGHDAVAAVIVAAVRILDRHVTGVLSIVRKDARQCHLLAELCVPSFAKGDGKVGTSAAIDQWSAVGHVAVIRVDLIPQLVEDGGSIRPRDGV